MTLKAIETSYKGYRFRSRLEARWAVFFDALGIKWRYEPEGFQLPSGRYLPDFFLPEIDGGWWIEVKPEDLSDKDAIKVANTKLAELVEATGFKGMIVHGEPMISVQLAQGDADTEPMRDAWWMTTVYEDEDGARHIGGDGPYLFCVCTKCGKAGLEFDGRGDRVCGTVGHTSPHGDKGYSGDDERIVAAAYKARSARFEFGECGAPA